jgi:hypothetical protein
LNETMPLDGLDLPEGLGDLLDLVFNWRFWLPVFAALGMVWYMHSHIGAVSHPAVRWVLYAPVLVAGGVTGWLWNCRS